MVGSMKQAVLSCWFLNCILVTVLVVERRSCGIIISTCEVSAGYMPQAEETSHQKE